MCARRGGFYLASRIIYSLHNTREHTIQPTQITQKSPHTQSQNTKDICEFLIQNITDENKHLLKPVDKVNNVSLHISCHSRAQNIGQKATELLRLIPQLKLDVIERCSGHGGSWGIKKNNFEMAIKVGKPVARKVIQFENEYVVSECPLAGTHIQQGANKIDNSKNVKVLSHPLEILAKSMSINLKED